MLVPCSLFDPAIAKQILGDIDASLTGSTFEKNTLFADSQIDIMIEGKTGTGQGRNMVDTSTELILYDAFFIYVEKPWFLSAPALVGALRTFGGQSKEMRAVKSLTCRVLLL
ncbi:hypothetical protein POM88_021729 [Heracleum sosnowskyi]|uniref:Uncharacterized protein n=1 Tax=Heracleum sosnowskyi TaxID=360622 RepID=A0AAD8IDY1_9APIA|nr:hypothetical protein POM88_021729 [Heracleum sosnowskyi]